MSKPGFELSTPRPRKKLNILVEFLLFINSVLYILYHKITKHLHFGAPFTTYTITIKIFAYVFVY